MNILFQYCFSPIHRKNSHGQLGVLTGLLIGTIKKYAMYHPIWWLSHKSKRPTKSTPAAEILAASEAIDEGKVIYGTYSELLSMDISVELCVDSKDLFTSMSTQRNSIERSIRGDVSCIRFELQVGSVSDITWIPGKINLVDPLTKPDSPITDSLQLPLFNVRLNLDYEHASEST